MAAGNLPVNRRCRRPYPSRRPGDGAGCVPGPDCGAWGGSSTRTFPRLAAILPVLEYSERPKGPGDAFVDKEVHAPVCANSGLSIRGQIP